MTRSITDFSCSLGPIQFDATTEELEGDDGAGPPSHIISTGEGTMFLGTAALNRTPFNDHDIDAVRCLAEKHVSYWTAYCLSIRVDEAIQGGNQPVGDPSSRSQKRSAHGRMRSRKREEFVHFVWLMLCRSDTRMSTVLGTLVYVHRAKSLIKIDTNGSSSSSWSSMVFADRSPLTLFT